MPSIDIQRSHSRSMSEARAAVERVAERIAAKFGIDYGWNGNAMQFKRAGVDGRIALAKDVVHVTANLGFLLSALKSPIEQEIHKYLDKEFG